jgi:MFS family permease
MFMNQRRLFYGWIIVGVSFINLAVVFGIWYSFSVFFVAILNEFGWSRAATAGVFSCFMLVHSGAAVLIGTLLDRFGARIVIPAGTCIVAVGLFASSRIDLLWEYYLWYGVLTPIGVCAIGFIAHGIVLPKWFDRKRGLAIGIAMAGVGVGMQVIVPATQLAIDSYGWRSAYCFLAVLVLLTVLPLNAFLQRKSPAHIGEVPDGAAYLERKRAAEEKDRERKKIVARAPVAVTIHDALRTKQFWFLCAAFVFTPLAVQGTLIHQVASVIDRGFTPVQGAFFFGLAGIMGSAGKILFGYLSDIIGRERAFAIGMGCAFLGVVSLMVLQPDLGWLLYGYALLFGLGYGSVAPLFPARSADLFLGADFGKIVGMLSLGGGIGGALGVWLSGKIFDMTESYQVSFGIALVAILIAIGFFWLSRAPAHEHLAEKPGPAAAE